MLIGCMDILVDRKAITLKNKDKRQKSQDKSDFNEFPFYPRRSGNSQAQIFNFVLNITSFKNPVNQTAFTFVFLLLSFVLI
jgi:hypothetical protein